MDSFFTYLAVGNVLFLREIRWKSGGSPGSCFLAKTIERLVQKITVVSFHLEPQEKKKKRAGINIFSDSE